MLFAAVVFTTFSSCQNPPGKNKAGDVAQSKSLYTCPMHPEITNQKPGECPVCGMHLVKMEHNPQRANHNHPEGLPELANDFSMGIPLTTMTNHSKDMSIEVLGDVQNDTRELASISARVSGRIEKLYVRHRYQMVQPGEKVMDIYSPEVATAQQNLLFIVKNDVDNTSLLESAKQRLLLMGMSSSQLQQLLKSGNASNTISVYSKTRGYVREAGDESTGSTNEMQSTATVPLAIREGMYVQAGEKIFLLTNPDRAVAVLNLLPESQGLVSVGTLVKIVPETQPAKAFEGKVDFVEPFYREGSKSLAARVYFDNSRLKIPVGSQVRANVHGNSAGGNWLPGEAVLSLGLNEVAFVKTSEGFEARKIITGLKQDNLIQVISGLAPSDSVAAHAQYITDSESLIKINQ